MKIYALMKCRFALIEIHDSEVHSGKRGIYNSIEYFSLYELDGQLWTRLF